jgi:hypothetical protein
MKHLIYLLLFLWVWVLPANAQSVFLAPRAGLNLSTITQTGGSLKSGLNFGISGEYTHPSRLAAEVGLYYSMQGTKFKKGAGASPEHNYINIPILFKYYLRKGADEGTVGGLNFFAGPQIDVKALVNKVSYAEEYKGILLSDDMTRLFGASAVIGVGYLFDIGLMFSANLNIGLTNKAKERFNNYGTSLTSSGLYKDFVAQINFGYRFAFR